MGIEPMTSSLPRMRSTTELRRLVQAATRTWSGRRDSNPQHLAWKASALPLRYARPVCDALEYWVRPVSASSRLFQILVLGEGFEPSQSLSPPGLQPGAINHSTTPALHRTRLKPARLSRGSIQITK